jgi:hypothetical protein
MKKVSYATHTGSAFSFDIFFAKRRKSVVLVFPDGKEKIIEPNNGKPIVSCMPSENGNVIMLVLKDGSRVFAGVESGRVLSSKELAKMDPQFYC